MLLPVLLWLLQVLLWLLPVSLWLLLVLLRLFIRIIKIKIITSDLRVNIVFSAITSATRVVRVVTGACSDE